ncbi:MAG: MarR family transcriptional regulator [Chloroflexi bacterium]|nr:MAG: MarR family transcriptional regulator [Chloroflexota bacterium]
MGTMVKPETGKALWKLLRDGAFASLREDFTARVAECELSLSQGKLIRELAQPQSQRELARRLHYDPSNITALADSLEQRGLLQRRSDRADRRFRLLALTPAGERLRLTMEKSLSEPPEFLNRLSGTEQKELLRLLSRIFDPTLTSPA